VARIMDAVEETLFRQVLESHDSVLASASDALSSAPGSDNDFEDAVAVSVLRTALADDQARRAFSTLLEESLQIMIHSFFAILDGAAADDPSERVVVVDQDGQALGPALHERWVEYLAMVGRLG